MWTIQLSFLPFFIICKSLLSYLTLHITSQFLTRTVQWSSTSFSNMIWCDIFNCNWVATRWQLFSTHIHTNNTGNVTKQTIHRTTQKIHRATQQLRRVRAVPRLCGFYPDICLTTEEKARKNLSQRTSHNSPGIFEQPSKVPNFRRHTKL